MNILQPAVDSVLSIVQSRDDLPSELGTSIEGVGALWTRLWAAAQLLSARFRAIDAYDATQNDARLAIGSATASLCSIRRATLGMYCTVVRILRHSTYLISA